MQAGATIYEQWCPAHLLLPLLIVYHGQPGYVAVYSVAKLECKVTCTKRCFCYKFHLYSLMCTSRYIWVRPRSEVSTEFMYGKLIVIHRCAHVKHQYRKDLRWRVLRRDNDRKIAESNGSVNCLTITV